jgi:hypothetical protein
MAMCGSQVVYTHAVKHSKAALVFGRYIKELDDPLLCKFEVLLESVIKRTQVLKVKNMKNTIIIICSAPHPWQIPIWESVVAPRRLFLTPIDVVSNDSSRPQETCVIVQTISILFSTSMVTL